MEAFPVASTSSPFFLVIFVKTVYLSIIFVNSSYLLEIVATLLENPLQLRDIRSKQGSHHEVRQCILTLEQQVTALDQTAHKRATSLPIYI